MSNVLQPRIIKNDELGINFNYWYSDKLMQRVYLAVEIVEYLGYKSGTNNLHKYELEDDVDMIKIMKRNKPEFFKQLSILDIVGSRASSALFLTESGVFKLLLKSNKKFAKDMRNWICRDVLPSIKNTGQYIAGEEIIVSNQLIEPTQYTFGVKQIAISKETNYNISIGSGNYIAENNNNHVTVHGRTAQKLRSIYRENGSAKNILRKHEPIEACALAIFENLLNNNIERDKIIESGIIDLSKGYYEGFEKLGIPLFVPVPKALKK